MGVMICSCCFVGCCGCFFFFFFSSRRRHTRLQGDWSSDVCSSDLSMAMGEWLSVQSARELNQRQLAVEAEEIATVPEEEQQELALIYEAKGLTEDEAKAIAAKLMADKDSALDALAREELGIDPQELGGSAWAAAG